MTKDKKKATSIKIDSALLKDFKVYCAKKGVTMTSVLNAYISNLVKNR